MKNKLTNICIYVLVVAGLLVLNYPGIATLYNRLHEGSVMATHEQALDSKTQAELTAVKQAAIAYNERLAQAGSAVLADAFADQEQEADREYNELLNINQDGIMGYIEIPGINVYMVVYHGTTALTLERGAGHLEGSSLPVGGASTHAVITGHRGLPSAELFTDLDLI